MKRFITAAAAVALGAGLATLGSAPAQADPYDCSGHEPNFYSYSVKCTNGHGEYRAYTKCNASLAFDYTAYGKWVRVGQVSTAVCISASIKDKAESPQGTQVR